MSKATAGILKHNAAIRRETPRVEGASLADLPDEEGVAKLQAEAWISFTDYHFKIGFPFLGGIIGLAGEHEKILADHPKLLLSWLVSGDSATTLVTVDRHEDKPVHIPADQRYQVVSVR